MARRALRNANAFTRNQFRALIDGDIAWLLRQRKAPAREHILQILLRAEAQYFPPYVPPGAPDRYAGQGLRPELGRAVDDPHFSEGNP